MSVAEESVWRTLAVAVGVALACSAMVTVAVHLLRPVQAAYAAVERNRSIVTAAGAVEAGASDEAVVRAFLDLDAEVVDLVSGSVVPGMDARAFDHWAVEGEGRPDRVPVYLRREGGRLERVVLPVDGKGMWSTIRAYLALEGDLNTVADLVIYDHGETPGIGDRIEHPAWLSTWRGKRVRNEAGTVTIDVSDDPSLPADSRVDTITGATVTSRAVGRLVRDWLGSDGYAAVLTALEAQEGAQP